jgi:hypothetical protein
MRTGHVMRVVALDDPDALRGAGLWFFMGDAWDDAKPVFLPEGDRAPGSHVTPALVAPDGGMGGVLPQRWSPPPPRARRAGDPRQHQPSTATASARPSHLTSRTPTSTSRRRHSLMLARCTCRSICRLRETVSPGVGDCALSYDL